MSVSRGYDAAAAGEIISSFGSRPEMLVQILAQIVERFGYVPEDGIRQLADKLNLSRADVHGVVSYYHDFRTAPPGRHIVKVCQAEACQAMGSRTLTDHVQSALGVELDGTADDVTLEPVYCLGNCACAPAVMIDGRTYGRVDAERFDELLGALSDGEN